MNTSLVRYPLRGNSYAKRLWTNFALLLESLEANEPIDFIRQKNEHTLAVYCFGTDSLGFDNNEFFREPRRVQGGTFG